IEGMVFAEKFAELSERDPALVTAESIVFVKGKIDRKRETPCLLVSDILPLDEAPQKLTTSLLLKLDPTKHQNNMLQQIKPLLQQHKGGTPVFVQLAAAGNRQALIKLDSTWFIRPSRGLKED